MTPTQEELAAVTSSSSSSAASTSSSSSSVSSSTLSSDPLVWPGTSWKYQVSRQLLAAHKDAIVSEERHLFPNKVNLLIRNKKHLEALMWVWLRACPRHYYSRTVNCFPSSADNWTEVYYYQLEAGQVVISGSARYALFIRDTRTSWTLILLPSLTFLQHSASKTWTALVCGFFSGHVTSFPRWSGPAGVEIG